MNDRCDPIVGVLRLARRDMLRLGATAALLGGAPISLMASPARDSTIWNFGAAPVTWDAFELVTGDTMVAAARVNGREARGILDTGSGASILSTALAQSARLERREARTISGFNGKTEVAVIHEVEVVLGGERRVLPYAIVSDLSTVSTPG